MKACSMHYLYFSHQCRICSVLFHLLYVQNKYHNRKSRNLYIFYFRHYFLHKVLLWKSLLVCLVSAFLFYHIINRNFNIRFFLVAFLRGNNWFGRFRLVLFNRLFNIIMFPISCLEILQILYLLFFYIH